MGNDGFFDVVTKSITEDFMQKGAVVLKENLRYPFFTTKDARFENVLRRMNSFYLSSAQRYSKYAKKSLVRKTRSNSQRVSSALMNYNISYCDENYICVVVDITGFDKDMPFGARFAHTWSVQSSMILPASHFIKTDRKSISQIRTILLEHVRKNRKNVSFGYYGDCEKRLIRAFDIRNFCILPKGFAFFIDPGILCDTSYGPSVFLLPKEILSTIMKVKFTI